MLRRKDFLFNRFVKLIEENHQEITNRFMNDLLKHADTAAYRNIDRDFIYESSDRIYRDLSKWIAREYPKKKIEERYSTIGKDSYISRIPFHQAQKALVLQKRHLWLFVIDMLDDDNTMYMEAIELNNRVALYFDRAIYYMLKGYEKMIYNDLR